VQLVKLKLVLHKIMHIYGMFVYQYVKKLTLFNGVAMFLVAFKYSFLFYVDSWDVRTRIWNAGLL